MRGSTGPGACARPGSLRLECIGAKSSARSQTNVTLGVQRGQFTVADAPASGCPHELVPVLAPDDQQPIRVVAESGVNGLQVATRGRLVTLHVNPDIAKQVLRVAATIQHARHQSNNALDPVALETTSHDRRL